VAMRVIALEPDPKSRISYRMLLPADDKTSAGEAHHLRLEAGPSRRGNRRDRPAVRRAVCLENLAAYVQVFAAEVAHPGHHETAIGQRRHVALGVPRAVRRRDPEVVYDRIAVLVEEPGANVPGRIRAGVGECDNEVSAGQAGRAGIELAMGICGVDLELAA